jgi:hypothetical protein
VAVGCGANEDACKKFREKMRDANRRIPVAELWIFQRRAQWNLGERHRVYLRELARTSTTKVRRAANIAPPEEVHVTATRAS